MKELYVFDKKNYDKSLPRHTRKAVRAIIKKNDDLVLVKNKRQGYYQFPGGGLEPGESHLDTITRETAEETGLTIIPESVKEYGIVREVRRDLYRNEIFEQISYYYYAEVSEIVPEEPFEPREAEAGFIAECVSIKTALDADRRICNSKNGKSEFLKRETYVLELLFREKLLKNCKYTNSDSTK